MKQLRVVILTLFVISCISSCSLISKVRPVIDGLAPDVLQPSEIVKTNPVGTIVMIDGEPVLRLNPPYDGSGYFIVTKEFMTWVFELSEEIRRLRK